MKKRINLLYSRKNYANIRNFIKYFRFSSYLLGAVTIAILGVVLFLKSNAKSKFDLAASKKENLLKESIRNKELEKSAIFLNDKSVQFNTFLSEDVNFLPYYRILREYLPTGTASAAINLISYDNKKNTVFLLDFSEYENFIFFLENVEDDKFLRIFENLTIESFSISEARQASYQLKLVGKFKPIENEITN